jgi:hypothetical protein
VQKGFHQIHAGEICKIIKIKRVLGVISGVTEWGILSKLSKINVKVCVESEI